jgi:hypothetical protein
LAEKRKDRKRARTAGAAALAYMESVCERIVFDPTLAGRIYEDWSTSTAGVSDSGYDTGTNCARAEAWKKELDGKRSSGAYSYRMCRC